MRRKQKVLRYSLILGIVLLSAGTGVLYSLAQTPIGGTADGAYAVLEPSGCIVDQNQVRLRIDMFLTPEDPYYSRFHVFVIDEKSPEFLAGYPGVLDKDGKPVDRADYDKWWANLPHIWQDNPFHSHFIYLSPTVNDTDVKQKITDTLTYFYGFYEACWKADKPFIEEWKKIPESIGTYRSQVIPGPAENFTASQTRIDDIKSRLADFGTVAVEAGSFTLPVGEQTIDVGPGATDRASNESALYTYIVKTNSANAIGITDTFEIWANTNMTGCECALFYVVSGDNLSTRDSEAIGNVTAGSKQTFTGLSMTTVTGDYLGVYFLTGTIDEVTSGGGGIWYEGADRIPCVNNAFGTVASWEMSIYATGVEVAFPVVESSIATNDTATATTTAVNYPATVSAGALLVCIARATVAGAIGWASGWNELTEDTSDASDDTTAIAWRAAVGNEDGTTFNVTHGSGKMAATVYSITGAADPATRTPELSTVAVGTSTTPNPTTCTPTGGSKNYLWLWLGGWEGEQTSPPASSPLNYSMTVGANTGTSGAVTTNCRVAGAALMKTAASEDPPSWTISVSDDWSAWCMAVHPPSGEPTPTPTPSKHYGFTF